MKLKNKSPKFLVWYQKNLNNLFWEYGEYVESMLESKEYGEMENLNEWLDEEWKIYQENNKK